MAKAKKQGGSVNSGTGATRQRASAIRAEAKSKAPAKGGANRPAASGGPGVPLIDTNLAAAAAASMVLNRVVTTPAPAPAEAAAEGAGESGDKRETSTFKQLKEGLSKPGGQSLGGILGGVQGGKKSNQSFGGGNQVRRNQTFGSDANRHNVPRRTGG